MKFEFIKEEKLNGTIIYYTKINGSFVDGSLELTEEKLFKLLKRSAETGININDLSNISV